MQTNGSKLLKEEDRLCEYRYQLTEFYVLINGEKDELPIERISSFKIEHYFEEALFPIFKISLVMEQSRYYKMMQNKKDVKFKVRIQEFYTINDTEESSMLRDVINDTFVFFPDDDDSNYDIDVKKDDESQQPDDTNKLEALENEVDLFLFKEMVTSLRGKCNYILQNVNLSTAVTYMLYKGGAKNVLMSPFENNDIYNELVLPPQSYDKQLMYLNNNFGFHKEGSIVYFGLYHSYILNCKAGCTAYAKKEWQDTVIYVLERTNSSSQLEGAIIRKDEEKFYFLSNSDTISIENTLVTQNVTGGVNPKIIDVHDNVVNTNESGAKDVNSENDAIVFNTTSNKFMPTATTAQMKANGLVISMKIDNVNMDAFNPNKRFSIIFENQAHNDKYKGIYRISTALYTFNHSGADFSLTAILTFKKVG